MQYIKALLTRLGAELITEGEHSSYYTIYGETIRLSDHITKNWETNWMSITKDAGGSSMFITTVMESCAPIIRDRKGTMNLIETMVMVQRTLVMKTDAEQQKKAKGVMKRWRIDSAIRQASEQAKDDMDWGQFSCMVNSCIPQYANFNRQYRKVMKQAYTDGLRGKEWLDIFRKSISATNAKPFEEWIIANGERATGEGNCGGTTDL